MIPYTTWRDAIPETAGLEVDGGGWTLCAGVEGTINQALDITGIRRARYRGLPKVRLQHAFSATALNVIRLDAHWTTDPLDRPRHSRLERLSYRLSA
ncbi:transposase [Streptomyces mirabilis]|uniref:transposase n=1 Tax=Streptomyces mirabilis TaxID=68239 RepID=UPI0036341B97